MAYIDQFELDFLRFQSAAYEDDRLISAVATDES